MFGRILFGMNVPRAPEDDQGGAPADDLDLDLDNAPEDDADPDEDDLPDEDEPDEDPDDLGLDEPPARTPSRGDRRVAEATRQAAEAKAERDRLAEELAAERRARAQPQETQEQLQARFDAMEPWQQTEFLRQRDAQRTQARLDKIEFDSWDRSDKLEYEALALREPIAAKLKDDVEKLLGERRKLGQNVDRATVLKFLIGDRALANKGRAEGRARKSADANRERQTARPGNGRADTTGAESRRGDSAAARAKRLENLTI